jgi:hypothetical protein
VATISALSDSNSETTAGPDKSSRSPREAESLMVNTTAWIVRLLITDIGVAKV